MVQARDFITTKIHPQVSDQSSSLQKYTFPQYLSETRYKNNSYFLVIFSCFSLINVRLSKLIVSLLKLNKTSFKFFVVDKLKIESDKKTL